MYKIWLIVAAYYCYFLWYTHLGKNRAKMRKTLSGLSRAISLGVWLIESVHFVDSPRLDEVVATIDVFVHVEVVFSEQELFTGIVGSVADIHEVTTELLCRHHAVDFQEFFLPSNQGSSDPFVHVFFCGFNLPVDDVLFDVIL